MTINPKKLFLVDSLGAILSTFLLAVILVRFESAFGMPRNVLYFLSIIAFVFAINSFINYLLVKENWKPSLKTIAVANLLYCGITLGLTIYFNKELTSLGLIYFFSELAVIVTLAIIELKAVSKIVGVKT